MEHRTIHSYTLKFKDYFGFLAKVYLVHTVTFPALSERVTVVNKLSSPWVKTFHGMSVNNKDGYFVSIHIFCIVWKLLLLILTFVLFVIRHSDAKYTEYITIAENILIHNHQCTECIVKTGNSVLYQVGVCMFLLPFVPNIYDGRIMLSSKSKIEPNRAWYLNPKDFLKCLILIQKLNIQRKSNPTYV